MKYLTTIEDSKMKDERKICPVVLLNSCISFGGGSEQDQRDDNNDWEWDDNWREGGAGLIIEGLKVIGGGLLITQLDTILPGPADVAGAGAVVAGMGMVATGVVEGAVGLAGGAADAIVDGED